jgi:hypothetical protein
MKGHGPFSITLQNGKIFDAPKSDTTFEVNGAIITVTFAKEGHQEAQTHVIKLWEQLRVADADVEG